MVVAAAAMESLDQNERWLEQVVGEIISSHYRVYEEVW